MKYFKIIYLFCDSSLSILFHNLFTNDSCSCSSVFSRSTFSFRSYKINILSFLEVYLYLEIKFVYLRSLAHFKMNCKILYFVRRTSVNRPVQNNRACTPQTLTQTNGRENTNRKYSQAKFKVPMQRNFRFSDYYFIWKNSWSDGEYSWRFSQISSQSRDNRYSNLCDIETFCDVISCV